MLLRCYRATFYIRSLPYPIRGWYVFNIQILTTCYYLLFFGIYLWKESRSWVKILENELRLHTYTKLQFSLPILKRHLMVKSYKRKMLVIRSSKYHSFIDKARSSCLLMLLRSLKRLKWLTVSYMKNLYTTSITRLLRIENTEDIAVLFNTQGL